MGTNLKWYIGIAFAIGIMLGFFLNKQDYRVVVKEVKGDSIKEVVHVPSPSIQQSKLDIASLPHYVFKEIVRIDTITNIAIVDTLAILRDYIAIKNYSYTLFNNEYGKLTLDQNTQYNSITHTSYNYEPIRRIETKLKKWQILIGGGYSSNSYVGPSVGVIYKNFGVIGGYRYSFSEQKNVVDMSFIYTL
ncbi:hypothetical protein [Bacteroides propionicifaciens]|uniref:hypothetical protein n=1 Tax=Bacteroides propionicifaciens TaxID=392838 RepID=UPI000377F218|nr:hypothetical protein [Bacteroides propionicifaciens]